MQGNKRNLAGLLSAASCSLLGIHAPVEAEDDWTVDSAILYYSEVDRVTAVEPAISLTREFDDDEILSMKLVFDSLTGASANAAVPSTKVQTFLTPSGGRGGDDDDDDDDDDHEGRGGSYTVAPNETPLDDTFEDERIAFSLNWEKPLDRNSRRNLGFSVSSETDFLSAGFNAGWQQDLNRKNTTLNAAFNLEFDQIDPIGGAPVPLSDMLDRRRTRETEDRQVLDLLFGVTQIIDRSSLVQFNLSLSEADGYMTDPYKFVSVVDDTGEPIQQFYENRPDYRSRQALFAKYKKMFGNKDILTFSYRYMTDDWGIDSDTFELSYRLRLQAGYYLEPQMRWYRQTGADFYRYFLRDDESVPAYVSADYRLGEMETSTLGFKFGRDINDRHRWSMRIARYLQSGDSSPDEAFGQLENQDLFPDVEAVIFQLNYSWYW